MLLDPAAMASNNVWTEVTKLVVNLHLALGSVVAETEPASQPGGYVTMFKTALMDQTNSDANPNQNQQKNPNLVHTISFRATMENAWMRIMYAME